MKRIAVHPSLIQPVGHRNKTSVCLNRVAAADYSPLRDAVRPRGDEAVRLSLGVRHSPAAGSGAAASGVPPRSESALFPSSATANVSV